MKTKQKRIIIVKQHNAILSAINSAQMRTMYREQKVMHGKEILVSVVTKSNMKSAARSCIGITNIPDIRLLQKFVTMKITKKK